MLEQYAKEGFAPFAAEWQHRHAYQGKPVRLLLPDGAAVTGKVAGVDASGALVLADGPRRARFSPARFRCGVPDAQARESEPHGRARVSAA